MEDKQKLTSCFVFFKWCPNTYKFLTHPPSRNHNPSNLCFFPFSVSFISLVCHLSSQLFVPQAFFPLQFVMTLTFFHQVILLFICDDFFLYIFLKSWFLLNHFPSMNNFPDKGRPIILCNRNQKRETWKPKLWTVELFYIFPKLSEIPKLNPQLLPKVLHIERMTIIITNDRLAPLIYYFDYRLITLPYNIKKSLSSTNCYNRSTTMSKKRNSVLL